MLIGNGISHRRSTYNPLLFSIQYIVLSIRAHGGGRLDVSDVTSSIWFRDSQSDGFLTTENGSDDFVFDMLRSKVDDGGESNRRAESDGTGDT
jgi:hypothetical protein